jgi:2-octaprenyl-6-methoxyphenol hydroxylase
MNVCIIGDGLTSLSLAKNLVNKKINVHIYEIKKKNLSPNRTIGISRGNFEFFKKKIQDIKKTHTWGIKKIEIYTEKIKNDKIINFQERNNNLFFMIKNKELYKILNSQLLKNKFFKKKTIKNNNFYKKLIRENKYDLVINCLDKNFIAKKYFLKIINKNYNNLAYTTILKHEKLENNTAIQIFTKYGPIAFLPISNVETSVVYSLDINKNRYNDKKVVELIKKYNPKFIIKKINKLDNFELKLSNLRNYYYKNILAFGDCLHKIHPLAGQGFNMTIRDIKVISEIIQNRINLGIQLDSSIFEEFEKKTKHINFIFSNGVDSIFEFFNFDKKIKNQNLNKILKFFGKNKILNNMFVKYADRGLKL